MKPSLITVLITAGAVTFTVTLLGVAMFRQWSLKRGLIDIPNERSSHVTPTPRGGGLVVALTILLVYMAGLSSLQLSIPIGFVIGGILIVTISWLDDIYSLAFHWRLLVHVAAAASLVTGAGWFATIYVPFAGPSPLGALGPVLSIAAIVWVVNAFNFMDGIDGLAGVQAASASVGWLLVALHLDIGSVAILSVAILAGSLGFLKHNWPPARIFLGDTGSAFLGFAFAAIPFLALKEQPSPSLALPWIALAMLWPFMFDSLLTLLRRVVKGERIWVAHRSHLYQRMVIDGFSHRRVTVIYLCVCLGLMLGTWCLVVNDSNPEPWALLLVAVSSAILLVSAAVAKTRAGAQ